MFMEITGGIAPAGNSADFLELKVCNVQMLTIQCQEYDAFVATSSAALDTVTTRFKLSTFMAADGTAESGLELNFPHTPYTGTLFFRSANTTNAARIVLLYATANPGMY